MLHPTVKARYIRIEPLACIYQCGLRAELYGKIVGDWTKISSSETPGRPAECSIIGGIPGSCTLAGWLADSSDTNPWIMVSMANISDYINIIL